MLFLNCEEYEYTSSILVSKTSASHKNKDQGNFIAKGNKLAVKFIRRYPFHWSPTFPKIKLEAKSNNESSNPHSYLKLIFK